MTCPRASSRSEGDYDAKPPEGTRDEVIAATEEDSDAISAEKDPGKRGRDDSRGMLLYFGLMALRFSGF